MQLAVGSWSEVGSITYDGKPVFPRLPPESGVYLFTWPDGQTYIGQATNLRKRMKGYRHWKKSNDNPRLFDALKSNSGTVSIITSAMLDGRPVDLSRRDGREMLEAFLRYTHRPTLNADN